jgi:hypothetical protein
MDLVVGYGLVGTIRHGTRPVRMGRAEPEIRAKVTRP